MPRPPTPTPGCTAKACPCESRGAGQAAQLADLGHVMIENRHALVVEARVIEATGTAERDAALDMVDARPGRRRRTLGADKGYDAAEFIADLRQRNVTPHVAQNTTNRRSAIDRRTTRHPGYGVSQRLRKRIEETFGWTKLTAGMRKTRHRGLARVAWMFTRPPLPHITPRPGDAVTPAILSGATTAARPLEGNGFERSVPRHACATCDRGD